MSDDTSVNDNETEAELPSVTEDLPELSPEEIKERLSKEYFKLVVTSTVWANSGTEEMPLWKAFAAQEYIVAYFQGEPTFEMIYDELEKIHELFDVDNPQMIETVAGYQVYFADAPTNSEYFQIEKNGEVDFPPIDLTLVGLSEEELADELARRKGEIPPSELNNSSE